MSSVDRAFVEQLLEDQSLSYREIARRAGCSDWSVRAIARERSGDARPMKSDRENDAAPGTVGWGISLVVFALFVLLILVGSRGPRSP